ncbi:MAG: serine/threonine-protein phosphatase [Magnetococcales bacterium]|nr:serine/threonine-protein phosphatase [Magnetococcales bacterium]MBF0584176.1 serine/threonine-protein phosphatase [Magnetococcales bacterium]
MAETIGGHLLVAGQTDVGCVRPLNEDNFHIDVETGLLVLADGMGGHDAGEVASAHLVASIARTLRQFMDTSPEDLSIALPTPGDGNDTDITLHDPQEEPTLDDLPNPVMKVVQDAVSCANAEINQLNREKGHPEDSGMGSTLVGLWAPPFSAHPIVFHVGDSRLYLFQRGQLTQATRDHSLYQQWVNFGGKGVPPPQNILLQAIGPSSVVTPDLRFLSVAPGDAVLLCSDGLTGMVSDAQIQETLATLSPDNLDAVCGQLVAMARKGGGKDNITVILGYFV